MKRIYPMHEYEQYLSAFSAHAIEYKGVVYQTVEHAYHCQRYEGHAEIQKEILESRSPYIAWEVSQKYKDKQKEGWVELKADVMEEICRAKLAQHTDVKEALQISADSVIIKDYPDPFWGIGPEGVGENKMGVIWMKIRKELQ